MDAGPERPHLGRISAPSPWGGSLQPGALLHVATGGVIFRRGVLAVTRARVARSGIEAGALARGRGRGLRPVIGDRWRRLARGRGRGWTLAGWRGRGAAGAGGGDLARNTFEILFRRLFRRLPAVAGQRGGTPYSLSLFKINSFKRERDKGVVAQGGADCSRNGWKGKT